MRRHLILIRHAKSDWSNAALADFDRPLNVRGECDAPMMGDRLAGRGIQIDRMISSPARRARSTSECIARSLSVSTLDIEWMSELYLASPQAMLDIITTCPDPIRTLAIVGHNPGISTLASQLCETDLGDMPTCAIVHLCGDFKAWRQIGRCDLVDFDYPRRHT